jgi:hypothetical protein
MLPSGGNLGDVRRQRWATGVAALWPVAEVGNWDGGGEISGSPEMERGAAALEQRAGGLVQGGDGRRRGSPSGGGAGAAARTGRSVLAGGEQQGIGEGFSWDRLKVGEASGWVGFPRSVSI